MLIPSAKQNLLDKARENVMRIEDQRTSGVITAGERHNKIIDIWHRVTEDVARDMFGQMSSVDPETGEVITAQVGRYGPYIKWGKESRSLEAEEQLFTVTLDESLDLLAKPRQRRGAKPPLKELGADPVTGKEIVIKDGRFGLYMTDGETNVSFRKAETVENVTLEHASERLAEKRARGRK